MKLWRFSSQANALMALLLVNSSNRLFLMNLHITQHTAQHDNARH